MKKFKFNLEPVLRHRKKMHDKAQQEFYQAKNFLDEQKDDLGKIEEKEKNHRENFKIQQKGKINLHDTVNHFRYLLHLKDKKKEKQKEIEAKEEEVNHHLEKLVESSKDKKVIEKLKEKKLRTFLKQIMDVEQKDTDESAVNRFIQKERLEDGKE